MVLDSSLSLSSHIAATVSNALIPSPGGEETLSFPDGQRRGLSYTWSQLDYNTAVYCSMKTSVLRKLQLVPNASTHLLSYANYCEPCQTCPLLYTLVSHRTSNKVPGLCLYLQDAE